MEVYEHYKDSGVPWIDEIPQLWTVDRFSMSFKFSRGLDIKKRDLETTGIPVLSYGQIHAKHNPVVTISPDLVRYIPADKIGGGNLEDARLREGDLVFADTSEDVHGAGNFNRSDGSQMIHAGYHTLLARPRETYEHKYFAYLFSSEAWRHQIRHAVQGVKVYSITQGVFKHAQLLRPPVETQDAIVAFLDAKTAEIDVVVEKLRRQRALLERHKRELIAHTVTKGLDTNAPMKDSGIDWIGKIPNRWHSRSLKSLLTRKSRKGEPSWRVLSVERERGVVDRELEGSPDNNNRLPDDLSGYLVVRNGQFVMNKMKAWQGSYGVSLYDGIVSPAYYTFDLASSVDSEFFNWAIRSKAYIPFFGRDSYGIRTDQWDFKVQALRNIPLFVPPVEEQRQIVDYLVQRMKGIDGLITDLDRQVESLGKYRKQVINDVVTGKVRVSEEAA